MKLLIVAVGTRMPAWVSEGFNEFARRMPREMPLQLIEVKAEPRTTGKTVEAMMAAEAQRLEAALPQRCRRVILDERGDDLTTVKLARRNPCQRLGFQAPRLAGEVPHHVHVQQHPLVAVIMSHLQQWAGAPDVNAHFLPQFPRQGTLQGLAGLDLAAGKLPQPALVTVARPAGYQYPARFIQHHAYRHVHPAHVRSGTRH